MCPVDQPPSRPPLPSRPEKERSRGIIEKAEIEMLIQGTFNELHRNMERQENLLLKLMDLKELFCNNLRRISREDLVDLRKKLSGNTRCFEEIREDSRKLGDILDGLRSRLQKFLQEGFEDATTLLEARKTHDRGRGDRLGEDCVPYGS